VKKSRVNSQQNTDNDVTTSDIANQKAIVLAVIAFLKLFITETVAKRVVCLLFLAANVSTSRIVELVSISAQTISKIRKAVSSGNIDSLFHIKSGGGRRKKLQTIAQSIIDMIITNNYHSLKEIVAMIKDKFGIVTSLFAVSNL
jgi:transposase